MAEEVYEVERIVGHIFEKKRNKTHILYNIKWLNYDDADNTWEKEANVFATDLVIKYWESLPKDSPDRKMFEHIQSLKKKPILLPSNSITQPVTVVEQPTADMVEETVVEKAPTPTKEPESKKQQSITDLFKSAASEVTSLVLGTKKDTPAAPVTKRMPVVVVNEEEDDDEDEEVNVEHVEPTRLKPSETKVDSNRSTPFQEDTDLDSDDKRSDSSKRKRPTASYSNYFLEQHEMKKRKTSPDTSSSTGDLNDVIFDEKYGISMDWESLAEKIVFVGREIKDAPLYCTVLWKDGVKSVHPVDQVRRKRPDLLIDYFLRQIDKH